MNPHFTLRTKLFLILSCLVVTTLGGSSVTFWYTYKIDSMFEHTVDKNIQSLFAAEELLNSLNMQKGFVTYYFLQGDEKWLEKLEKYNSRFLHWLNRARKTTSMDRGFEILSEIERKYIRYSYARDEIINMYKEGKRQKGARQHWNVRDQFFEIASLCAKYKNLCKNHIDQSVTRVKKQRIMVNSLALLMVLASLILGGLLAYLLFHNVLTPIRQLVYATENKVSLDRFYNEVETLSSRVHNLIDNVDQTQNKLAESREHLQQTEKMASVGKLAAGVAHSVRTPLTSVKMRLFSLERSLALDNLQQEDFDVISDEIRHIDTILTNFLEFSRRPKLQTALVDPSEAVDMAVQLMRHRLESNGINITVEKNNELAKSKIDSEQIKEVMVNILENACDAMKDGGSVYITLQRGVVEPLGHVVRIRIRDNGPGIPGEVQEQIFKPFFSTKDEGTGLGLSIAKRIIEDHGGWINLNSKPGEGTVFTVTLPAEKEKLWTKSS